MALCVSLRLSVSLCVSLWLSVALFVSLWLSVALRGCCCCCCCCGCCCCVSELVWSLNNNSNKEKDGWEECLGMYTIRSHSGHKKPLILKPIRRKARSFSIHKYRKLRLQMWHLITLRLAGRRFHRRQASSVRSPLELVAMSPRMGSAHAKQPTSSNPTT